jgi:hypothetical protein
MRQAQAAGTSTDDHDLERFAHHVSFRADSSPDGARRLVQDDVRIQDNVRTGDRFCVFFAQAVAALALPKMAKTWDGRPSLLQG